MRTLSTTLQNKQIALNYSPLWKAVFSRTGQTTRGYSLQTPDICMDIDHIEEEWKQSANVTINNATGNLTSLDLSGYQCDISYGIHTGIAVTAWVANTAYVLGDVVKATTSNGYQYKCVVAGNSHAANEPTWPTDLGVRVVDNTVTWEMDGNEGDEYSLCAPLWVLSPNYESQPSGLFCTFSCFGIMNRLETDEASADYILDSSDTQTVKTLIRCLLGDTGVTFMACFNHAQAYNASFDAGDSLIDSYIPQNSFRVLRGESRLSALRKLIGWTKMVVTVKNDGKVYVTVPVISGAVYDYQYALTTTDHNFFSKGVRKRLVVPNYIEVKSYPDDTTIYSGTATDATSNAILDIREYLNVHLVSNAQASSIAAAKIQRLQVEAELGHGFVPMNVGQEINDYVLFTDAREGGSTRTGNILYQRRRCSTTTKNWAKSHELRLGNVSLGDSMGTIPVSTGGASPTDGLYWMIMSLQKQMYDVVAYLRDRELNATFDRLTVRTSLIIPEWP